MLLGGITPAAPPVAGRAFGAACTNSMPKPCAALAGGGRRMAKVEPGKAGSDEEWIMPAKIDDNGESIAKTDQPTQSIPRHGPLAELTPVAAPAHPSIPPAEAAGRRTRTAPTDPEREPARDQAQPAFPATPGQGTKVLSPVQRRNARQGLALQPL